MKQFNNVKSLTLIELVVVVIIIAVITAAGLVSFSMIAGRRLEAEARKIVSDLSWARQMAVTQHEHRGIRFDPANKRYFIYRSPNGTVADLYNPIYFLKQLELEVFLSLIQTNLWFYYPKGNAFGTNNVTLNSQGKTIQIRIFSDTGYVRIE